MRRHLRFARAPLAAALAILTLAPAAANATRIAVTNTNDSFAGSLRQAVIDSAPGDTVVFDPSIWGSNIVLASGDIVTTQDVTILGPDRRLIALSGSTGNRLFSVNSGNLKLQGLALYGSGSFSPGAGGILWVNIGAFLTVTDCLLFNGITGASGGNIEVDGTATLLRCALVSGQATGSSNGGAVTVFGNLTATDCLFQGNTAATAGGGIYCEGNMNLVRCTFSGNSAGVGGAIHVAATAGLRALYDCTIANNSASSSTGGIRNLATSAILANTIVAGNTAGDVAGTFDSHGYNAIGDGSNAFGLGAQGSHDQVGTTAQPFPAGLGPLQDNGGPTATMVPLPGSLVIDQGLASGTLDARGHRRVYDNPAVANVAGGDGSDVGATEAAPPAHFEVTTTDDHGAGSFRQAVLTAGPADSVTFRPDVTGTIALTGGEVFVPRNATILGPGPNALTIDAGYLRPAIVFLGAASPVATLRGLAFTHAAARSALDIDSQCSVTLDLLAVTDCRTGAIRNLGSLALSRSLLARCNASLAYGGSSTNGGGVDNVGSATIVDCTVASDTAQAGGGLCEEVGAGPLTVRNCTIVNNVTVGTSLSARRGGGIASGATTALTSTLVAGNRADVSGPDVFGQFSSGGYNLVGVGDGSFGLANGANQDQVGSGASPLAPLLGPLADNGGPTLTALPLAGSPAIDQGFATGLATDQRQRARVFDDGAVANAAGGDGSDVGACERGAATVDVPPGPPAATGTGAQVDRIDRVAPDPAVGVFRVRFTLARAGEVDLALFDVAGRRVAALARGELAAGQHEVAVERGAGRPAAGIYWLRLVGPSGTSVRRVVQLR